MQATKLFGGVRTGWRVELNLFRAGSVAARKSPRPLRIAEPDDKAITFV
jgi:hypothetical protein